LTIRKAALGENDISVADNLCWIGNIHREKKELNEARHCFTSAHQIKVSVLGYHHPECSEILQNLGIICNDLEMYSSSLSHFKEAMLNRRANIKGPHDIEGLNDLCESLHCIANVYRLTGQFERALQFSEQVLKRRRAMAATADTDQTAKLIRVYEDLVALTKLISRDDDGSIDKIKFAQVGIYLMEVGKLYDHKLSKPMKALLYYQEAMDAFKEVNDHINTIACLTSMGNVHVRSSSNDKALSCFSKGLVLTLRKDSGVPKQSACHADLLHSIGNCQSKKGKDHPVF
jgi:tetratricopeptide (TPR) repeat protein